MQTIISQSSDWEYMVRHAGMGVAQIYRCYSTDLFLQNHIAMLAHLAAQANGSNRSLHNPVVQVVSPGADQTG